ncbi:MAG: hypothetical protein P0Y53_14945 [Candidatus Pseudobacter hemicellulosilyticus]|uniref:Uncharacterized protein n=1 Tax=Candidatus Pseudobacter hemicellulosilyticus TaxID=3121375 RepID=A0AAJ6BF17_9BACT|nr:MAG: hypothetical protein P0Y53_14945 [Pseudobacter sp.]
MSKKVKKQEEEVQKKKPEDRYPVFCFKHLHPGSYSNCSDASFFIEFLGRLKKLGELGWQGINNAARHSFGTEKMPVRQLKIKNLPRIITPEVEVLTVFRAAGNNLPFLGIRLEDTFQVIFIETKFGDIYDH